MLRVSVGVGSSGNKVTSVCTKSLEVYNISE